MMEEMLDPRMERVIRYLEGDLSAAERSAFETDLAADPSLREDLDAARRTLGGLTALGEERLRAELKAADREAEAETGRGRWWWAAAAVLILSGLAWWMASRQAETPQQLAEEFTVAEPGLPVLMGVEPGRMDAIMNAYKRGDMGVVEQLLDAALRTDDGNDTLNYFRGVVMEQQKNCVAARSYFERVPDRSGFWSRSRYRMALCELRAGRIPEAMKHLDLVMGSTDAQLAGKARDLLERLKAK